MRQVLVWLRIQSSFKIAHKTISNSDDVDSEKPKLRNFYGKWKISDEEEDRIVGDIKGLWRRKIE